MLGLERHEFGDGAEIIAEMQVAGRLHAREDAGVDLGLLHVSPQSKGGLWLGREPSASSPLKGDQTQATSMSRICSAMATVRWAMAKCSRSTMRPSTTITPFWAFSA